MTTEAASRPGDAPRRVRSMRIRINDFPSRKKSPVIT
jgi:hypothetical protein